MPDLYGSDAHAPREVAQRIETVGVAKARLPTVPLLVQAGAAAPADRRSSPGCCSDASLTRFLGPIVEKPPTARAVRA